MEATWCTELQLAAAPARHPAKTRRSELVCACVMQVAVVIIHFRFNNVPAQDVEVAVDKPMDTMCGGSAEVVERMRRRKTRHIWYDNMIVENVFGTKYKCIKLLLLDILLLSRSMQDVSLM